MLSFICLTRLMGVLMELPFVKGLIHISPWPLVTKDRNNGVKLLLSSNTINSLLERSTLRGALNVRV